MGCGGLLGDGGGDGGSGTKSVLHCRQRTLGHGAGWNCRVPRRPPGERSCRLLQAPSSADSEGSMCW